MASFRDNGRVPGSRDGNAVMPEQVGSGFFSGSASDALALQDRSAALARSRLPVFPNFAQLVLKEEYAPLLADLLPALNKFKCLELDSTLKFTRKERSPWVRAFADLYRPGSGPWRNFKNSPAIESPTKYDFRRKIIETLYPSLRHKYRGSNPIHLELLRALNDYDEKQKYLTARMKEADAFYKKESAKPPSERARINTTNGIRNGCGALQAVMSGIDHNAGTSNITDNIYALAKAVLPKEKLQELADPRQKNSEQEEQDCRICFGQKRTIAFVPCGHYACCNACSNKIMQASSPGVKKRCPFCDQGIERTITVFMP